MQLIDNERRVAESNYDTKYRNDKKPLNEITKKIVRTVKVTLLRHGVRKWMIDKWTNRGEQKDYASTVLGIYNSERFEGRDFTGPATDFVKQTWAKYSKKIKEEARLIVAPGFSDLQVRAHLAYRFPIHIGVEYTADNRISKREQFNNKQHKLTHVEKFIDLIDDLDKIDRPVDTKLRYGVLNWTPVADWKGVPGIAKELYFLHTWGVNMESRDTVDAHYVFQDGVFRMDRYAELLDILFSIVKTAAEHLHQKTGGPVVVRMTGLGLGRYGWFKVVPTDKEPEVFETYKRKLAAISNDWLQVRHPQYRQFKTESFIKNEWKTVEENHDPFGDYETRKHTTIIDKYPVHATVMIVNAWDDGSFIGNKGTVDNTLDGWTVAGGSPGFYAMELKNLEVDYPAMKDATLGANALNASFLHNVFFTPQLLDPNRWIRTNP